MIKKLKIILYLTIASLWIPHSFTNQEPKITSLFSHGIAASKRQAFKYAQITPTREYNDRHIINNQHHILVSFNYPDAGESYHINRKETSLAQANEVQALHEAHINIEDEAGIVCLGVSRGASALIVWLGTHPDASKVQNIRALILESPFDSIDSVLRHIIGESLYKYNTFRSFSHGLVKFIFSKYDKNFITPLEAAINVPPHIPILIVCSAEDTRVPASLSKRLYDELTRAAFLKNGNSRVHFVKLKTGAHGKLIEGKDSGSYRNAVHAFYKKYDLPHHPEYADLGQILLDESQPIMDNSVTTEA